MCSKYRDTTRQTLLIEADLEVQAQIYSISTAMTVCHQYAKSNAIIGLGSFTLMKCFNVLDNIHVYDFVGYSNIYINCLGVNDYEIV